MAQQFTLLSAEEARNKAKDTVTKCDNEIMAQISAAINDAAANGKFTLHLDSEPFNSPTLISQAILTKLTSNGYVARMENNRNEHALFISWA